MSAIGLTITINGQQELWPVARIEPRTGRADFRDDHFQSAAGIGVQSVSERGLPAAIAAAAHIPEPTSPMDSIAIARTLFSKICSEFELKFHENPQDSVELNIVGPQQKGLSTRMWLGLHNNDELCFGVSKLQAHWFPCTNEEIVNQFRCTVCGFISGRNRVIEWRRGNRTVRSQLQTQSAGGWETVYIHNRPSLSPFPRKKLSMKFGTPNKAGHYRALRALDIQTATRFGRLCRDRYTYETKNSSELCQNRLAPSM